MTKSYAQLVKEIENLQVAADKARQKEVDGVIERIRTAIDAYALTAEDLGFGNAAASKAAGKTAGKTAAKTGTNGISDKGGKAAKAAKAPKAPKAPKAEPVVKFRNDSGGTWGGRGKRPRWLQEALAGGKTLADFQVKSS